MHNTNATADLSACDGTSATLGQHSACPDRDDTERTRPITTPSVPLSHDLCSPFVLLEVAFATYDASLTYISDDVVLFWHSPSAFSQWTPSPFTVDLDEYNCAEQFKMASKARLFGDDMALSAILAADDPQSRNVSAVKCVTLTTIYGKQNAKTSYYMATLRNSPKTRRCDLSLLEPATVASLNPALTIISGAST